VKACALILFLVGSINYLQGGTDNSYQGSNSVVAEVDGIKITLADFEQRRPDALFQARVAFYEAEKKAVDEFIDSYLLERRAQKENLTVTQLLERHVNNVIAKDPDDDALRVYYEGIDTNEPFEAVRGRIIEILRQRRIAKAKSAYMASLRNDAKVTLSVLPPRADVSLSASHVRGATGAPLTLIEFADYECPYCQQMQPAISKLEAEYKDKLAFAYKDVPLPMHAHAQKAAEAAHCAGVQNKYWEYHDVLLATKALEVPQLKSAAAGLALDTKAFDKCLDSGEQAETVRASTEEAQKLGIQGTPSFFLNGRFFSGIMSYDQLRQIVDEELKSTKSTPAKPRHTAER
jgi:protein-disulfide isomerase